jgi:starvation-inducible DNA-binding protein
MIAMKTRKTFATRIDLAPDVRSEMIALLNQQLANTFDLYSQTKQAHWNVKGAQFYPLHELFDKLAEELEGYADLIAERATALGGLAQGTVRLSAANSRLAEYPSDVTDSMATVEALAERYAALGAGTRQAIEAAHNQGDLDTADLFTEVSRGAGQGALVPGGALARIECTAQSARRGGGRRYETRWPPRCGTREGVP